MLIDIVLMRCMECNYFSLSYDFDLETPSCKHKCPECGSKNIERKRKHIGCVTKCYSKEEYNKVNR